MSALTFRRRPQTHETHRCCSHAILHCSGKAASFARNMHEAQLPANLIRAVCTAVAPHVLRVTYPFEAQLHANLMRAWLHCDCSRGTSARPHALADTFLSLACQPVQDLNAPQRHSRSCPIGRVACLLLGARLQRVCSGGAITFWMLALPPASISRHRP